MKAGWEVKPLGEVIEPLETVDPRKAPDDEFTYIDVSSVSRDLLTVSEVTNLMGEVAPSRARRKVRTNDVIFATIRPTLKRIAIIPPSLDEAVCSTGYMVLRAKAELDSRFLFYVLQSEEFGSSMETLQRGASYPAVSDGDIKTQAIPIPPLEEQKRIVAALDAAFEGLTRAKENAEANLQNARDLFEASQAKLLSDAGGGWFRKTISDCFKLKSGDGLTAKAMVHGEYAVYGGNGVAGHHNASNLTGENVIIGRVGALCGNARLIETDIWLTDNAFLVTDFQHDFDLPFLTFMLNFMNLRSFARQTAQPVISNSSLKDVVLSFPESRSTQTDIALKLLEIENEVEGLETNYRTKLTDISDLRQSLLQKAFAGELT